MTPTLLLFDIDGTLVLTGRAGLRAMVQTFEAEFGGEPVGAGADASVAFGRRNGRPLWRVTVPANGRVALRYRWKS